MLHTHTHTHTQTHTHTHTHTYIYIYIYAIIRNFLTAEGSVQSQDHSSRWTSGLRFTPANLSVHQCSDDQELVK